MKNKIVITGRTLMDNSLIREFIEDTKLSGRFDNVKSNFSFNKITKIYSIIGKSKQVAMQI